MKKKRLCLSLGGHRKRKILLMMKLCISLLLCFTLGLSASTLAQQERVNLDLKQVSIKVLFDEIQKQTNLSFVFNTEQATKLGLVSVRAVDETVENVLRKVLMNTGMMFEFDGTLIIVRPEEPEKKEVTKIKVTGKVKDEKGEFLPGVTILLKGTQIGAVTDVDGKFSFELPKQDNLVLVFSFIGYKQQEVKVNGEDAKPLAIVLKEDVTEMDEVVVTGIYQRKKESFTGSATTFKKEELKMVGSQNLIQSLKTLDPSFSIMENNQFGSDPNRLPDIEIRGKTSVIGLKEQFGTDPNQPLFILDGFETTLQVITDLNMERVESVTILKDAASTAIYGARGAGGVILVTTKKGKIGKLSINARVNFGIETPIDLPDMLHTADFIDRKLAAGFPNNPNSGWDNPASLPDTDWEDLVWRNAFRQNYFLQMTGGNEKTTFNMSAEFYKNQFIERYSFEDAGNFRVASQTNISKRVKFSEILTVGFNNTDPHLYGQTNNDYVYYRQVPTMVPYDNTNEAGGGWGKHPAGGYYEGPNHVATLMSHHANERRFWARANAILDWEIINDLKFQANFSANFDSHANNLFLESWNLGSLSQQDYYSKDYGSGYDLRMLYTLTYDHTFGEKHYVKGMVGYEAYRATASSAGGWKNGFLVQPSDDISLGTGDKDVSGTKTEGRSLSQFARVNYAYDDRYLLEASIRRDGYDNFGPENRFGVFPSASVGWNVGKESFVKDNITWMSQLKLRGSYGKIGNNTIPQFLYEPSFTNNYLYYSYDGQNTQRGFWYSNVANATIKWEDVAQWNIGVDASFLDNRLNTTIEYYDKKTSDMLYSVGVPPSAGPSSEPFSETSSYRANIGKISNRGFEWMVQWRDSYKDFRYDVAFTLSTNKNKVVKLSDQVNPIIWAGSDAALNSSIYRTENGQPMGQMYGYVVDGIIQDQAEIDALNAQSPDGLYQQAGTAPGDLKYKDLNGDGKVTNEDKTYIGNPWPDLMYGLNINLSWKGFDLSMGWLGNAGVDVFNSAKLYERSFYGDYNTTYKVYEAWSPTNRATSHPRVTKEDPNGNFKNVSSYFVEDGSFFKLKNLHFGYNLPKSILSHLKIEGLKFYINCDNLFIITKFQGDPELGGGYLERNMYSVKRAPSTRTIMGGLSLTL